MLKNLEKYYPGYKGQGYEVAGFVWWQGHKDQSAALAGRYEQNLVHLIKTLRADCRGSVSRRRRPEERQCERGRYARLWREADVSPVNHGYHYNHNAETYCETGEALGRAM